MVACDVTRNADLPQLYSDLAGLKFALSLIDYSPAMICLARIPNLAGRGHVAVRDTRGSRW